MNFLYIFLLLLVIIIIETLSTERLLRSSVDTDFPEDFNTRRSKDELVTIIIKSKKRFSPETVGLVSKASGFSVGHYIGERSFTMKAKVGSIEEIKNHDSVDNVGLYKPEHRYIRSKERKISKNKKEKIENELPFGFLSILIDPSNPLQTGSSSVMDDLTAKIETFLKRVSNDDPTKYYFSPNNIESQKMLIRIDNELKSSFIEFLSHQNEVHVFHDYHIPTEFNRDMKWVIGTYRKDEYISDYKGEGQIVAVGDSGLDVNNCYFHDSEHPVDFTRTAPTSKPTSEHRKIVQYWSMIDAHPSEERDHGTHCAGSISGNWENGDNPFNGISPLSKLAFTDFGCSVDGGCVCEDFAACFCQYYPDGICPKTTGSIYAPDEPDKNYFNYQYLQGARISSNSYGGWPDGYTTETESVDKFIWENPDFLPLFSNGNSGGDYYFTSLSSYAECKNCLAVGASENALESWHFQLFEMLNESVFRDNFLNELYYVHLECDRDNRWYNSCRGYDSERERICNFLNTTDWNTIDCCDTGAKFDICNVTDNADQCGCEGIRDDVGMGGSAFPDFRIAGHLSASCCKECIYQEYEFWNDEMPFTENVAFFSSQGPGTDGRVKPDIVATGYYISSAHGMKNRTECQPDDSDYISQLIRMAGTSMSCPSAAGAVSLIREYLMIGQSSTYSPTAALMKAFTINSAEKMIGWANFFGWDYPLGPDPEQYEQINSRNFFGWGRINLDNVLLNETCRSSMFFKERDAIQHGQTDFYCFKKASRSVDVKLTLVYTDYPSIPSLRRHLVNDLNLIAKYGKDFWVGNAEEKNTRKRDNVNNVEQIETITLEEGTRLVVAVEGKEVVMNPQGYALVVRTVGDKDFVFEEVDCRSEDENFEFIISSMDCKKAVSTTPEDSSSSSSTSDDDSSNVSSSTGGAILTFSILIFIMMCVIGCCGCVILLAAPLFCIVCCAVLTGGVVGNFLMVKRGGSASGGSQTGSGGIEMKNVQNL